MSENLPSKVAVSVTEMARMIGLSRARFYQLLKVGVFPPPLRDLSKNRPFFDQFLQNICLEVRKKNCGVNGEPILFYAQRLSTSRRKPAPEKKQDHADLVKSLKALGLTVTDAQVTLALQQLYPDGWGQLPQPQLIRAVFLHIKRQDSGDNVSR